MKRLITLLAMFFFIATARSQNITNAEYFFDSDPGPGNGTALTVSSPGDIVNINASISTAALSSGFHFLAIRVKDVNGLWGLYEKRGFYISSSTSDAANITAAEYFFDTDPGAGNGTALSVGASGAIVNFTANIPTSLSAGFHFLAIRVKGSDGIWGLFEKRGFYVSGSTSDAADITAAEYFLDSDPGLGNGTSLSVGASGGVVNFTANIPTALSAGFHFLAIRVKGSDGIWGLYEKRGFYISSSAVDAGNITSAEYFIDTDPGVGNGASILVGASGAVVNFTANIPTSVATGFHFLTIRVKGADGVWGLFEKRGFYVSDLAADAANITAAEYFFDADPGVGNATALTVTTPGAVVTQTFLIPDPGLSLGTHNLSIRIKGSDGKWGLYEYRQFTIGNSTITCPANASATAGTGQCTAVVNNIDPTINPPQAYNYSFSGATTGSGSGTASGQTFNAGTTTVTYSLTGSPSVSCSFTVTVTPTAPAINTQPTNQSACVGGNVTFSVGATGSGLTYQWRKGGINIGGATSSTFTINGVVAGDAGNYDVVVSIPCSLSTTSVTVSLTVGSTTINTQPVSQAVCAGANVTFSVSASGSGLTYQWRKSGANIGGATSSSYTINGVTAGDAANYDVVITGSCGNVTSNTATLTINAATQIGTNPTHQTVCAGGSATFSVSATGTGTLTYQWRKGGVNIGGATSSTYTINPAAAGDAGNYDVIVTGTCGSVTSTTASLTVNAVTAINTQPTNQSSCIGGSVTFSVSAVGTNLTYQWKKGGVDIGSATLSSYTINPVGAGDAATYTVVVTGTCGAVTSNGATLTLSAGTVINTQPASQPACLGGSITFSVSASGSGTVTYQWRKGGVNIDGATSSSYTINPVTAGDAANYDVLVSSLCGNTTSNAATLSILPTTSIGTQPTNQTVCLGSNATFTVAASGDNITYQWRKGGVNIGGATLSSYTLTGVVAGDVGNYDVVVTGTCGTVTSTTVSLSLGNVVISSNPANQTVCAGTNVTFSVTVTGLGLSYQWRKGGVNIGGATSSSYTITGVAIGDAGSYDVVVTGTCGPVTSNTATLTVNTSPVITTQPLSQSVCSGGNVTFSVIATGTGLTYQWRKGGVNIGGATSSSYTITAAVTGDAGNYDVVVSGTCAPSATSSVAVLTINQPPSITTQPQTQTTFVGSSVTFSVTATGTGLTYQWRKGGVNIGGATSSSYTINPVAVGDAGNYDVLISGTCAPSATSNVAVLTVNTVSITTQPTNQSVCVGANATFTVVANGNNLTYQWQVSTGGGPFTNINGAINASLTLTGVTQSMSGNQYRVVVSGSLNSNAVTLTVNPLPTVTLNLPFDTLYLNSPLQTLSGGTPTGGIYSGTGISGGQFMPGAFALGNYNVTYRYTDANGCTSSATDVFTIIPKADNVNLYPNPTKDGNVTLVTSPDMIGANATAYDLMGRKVYQWTVGSRLTTYKFKWSAGIYTFIFTKGNTQIVKQLVIGR
jgi:hypothetical protein